MKTFSKIPQSKAAFTLIELLIVIVIIAILASISLPVYNNIKRKAMELTAKNDCVNIQNAVVAYQTEYGRLPIDSSSTADAEPILTDGMTDLLKILMAEEEIEDGEESLNPRGIVYLEPKLRTARHGFDEEDGSWHDPWGNPYRVWIDGNYDKKIDASIIPGEDDDLRKSVAVASNGANGEEETGGEGEKRDDVKSWK